MGSDRRFSYSHLQRIFGSSIDIMSQYDERTSIILAQQKFPDRKNLEPRPLNLGDKIPVNVKAEILFHHKAGMYCIVSVYPKMASQFFILNLCSPPYQTTWQKA